MHAAELVGNYISAWNRRDPSGIVDLLSPDGFYFDVPVNRKLSGRALLQYLANDFKQRELRYELVGEILIGGSSIAFQYKIFRVGTSADSNPRPSGAEFLSVCDGQVMGIEDYYKISALPDDSELAGSDISIDSRAKYRKSGLSAEQAAAYKQRLLQSMEIRRLYRAVDLTLPQLAQAIDCSINHLSQLINGEFAQTFYEFLNGYRIADAKELLGGPSKSRDSIAQIAARVGFRSNSAFYVAFRRSCQQTPSEFRRQACRLGDR
jgi:AraC-like DNA-binding protein